MGERGGVSSQLSLCRVNQVFSFCVTSVNGLQFFFFIDFTYEYITTIRDMSAMNVGKRSFVTITLQSTRKYIQVRRVL